VLDQEIARRLARSQAQKETAVVALPLRAAGPPWAMAWPWPRGKKIIVVLFALSLVLALQVFVLHVFPEA